MGQHFQPIALQVRGVNRYTDFIGKPDQKMFYQGLPRRTAPTAISAIRGGQRLQPKRLAMMNC